METRILLTVLGGSTQMGCNEVTKAEAMEGTLKGDLGLRPVFHQLDGRIEAHVFISFLAFCLHVTLEQYNKIFHDTPVARCSLPSLNRLFARRNMIRRGAYR